MRLLYLNEVGDIIWKDFKKNESLPYTIFSYIWGSKEVSYKNLISKSGREKISI